MGDLTGVSIPTLRHVTFPFTKIKYLKKVLSLHCLFDLICVMLLFLDF